MGESRKNNWHLALVAAVFGLVASTSGARASTVTTAYQFDGATGMAPRNGNLLFSGGAIFGSTYGGGANDQGAIITVPLTADGTGTLVYSFTGTQGAHPNGSLVADAGGNLYGTTQGGGAANVGTIFKLIRPAAAGGAWGFSLLHEFAGSPDGAMPIVGLTFGPDGALYGTAKFGGTGTCVAPGVMNGCGTVFRITTGGAFRVIHQFADAFVSGRYPSTNVVVDPAGNVIGTTSTGATEADGGGNLFRIAPDGTFLVVSTFSVRGPIVNPIGTIVRDSAGSIYGMVTFSGTFPNPPTGAAVFKIAAITHKTSVLTTLGRQASTSGVTLSRSGALYYTTTGGSVTNFDAAAIAVMQGPGTVYALVPGSAPVAIASLDYANLSPIGSVIADSAGNLWGQSSAGGIVCDAPSNGTQSGCGTIYKLTP